MNQAHPYRLYRDPENGIFAGVAAGTAEYLGVSTFPVRLAWFLAFVFFFVPALLAYMAMAFWLPVRPGELYRDREEERRHRTIAMGPQRTLHDLKSRFRELELRLARMEAAVVSPEYDLKRQFREME